MVENSVLIFKFRLTLDYTVFVLSLSLGKVSAVVISTAVLVSKRLRRLLLLVIGLSRMIGSRGRMVGSGRRMVGGRCRVVGGRCSVRVDRAVISHSGANNKQANQQLQQKYAFKYSEYTLKRVYTYT